MKASELVLVFLGGGTGAVVRVTCDYGVTRLALAWDCRWPLGVFLVNIAGCFLLGVLAGWLRHLEGETGWLMMMLGGGFLGGFTTFSTFALQAVNLWRNGDMVTGAGYCVASVVLGLVMAWAGLRVTGS